MGILYILAPVVYIMIIVFGFAVAFAQVTKSRIDIAPVAAFSAGWVACAFSVILVRMAQLELPQIPTNLWSILVSGFIGFLVGFGYLALAKFVAGDKIMTSLYILGSVGGSLISFFFYIQFSQVQIVFSSSAVAFLFGVLLYVVFFEGRNQNGLQGAFREFMRRFSNKY